jgi:hypothetical protein
MVTLKLQKGKRKSCATTYRHYRFYQRALEICPNNCYVLFNYAIFLQQKREEKTEAKEFFQKALDLPQFESLDEILLLKDYSSYLRDQLSDNRTADLYSNRFASMKDDWEKRHQSDVEYPNYKATKVPEGDGNPADYGYVM